MKKEPEITKGNALHAMEALLAALPWRPSPPPEVPPKKGDLYATHYAELTFSEFKFRCYQLNDGQRVIDADDVQRFIEALPSNGAN